MVDDGWQMFAFPWKKTWSPFLCRHGPVRYAPAPRKPKVLMLAEIEDAPFKGWHVMMDISFPGKYAAQLARNSGNVQVYKCQSEKSIGFVEPSATHLQKICANPKWQSISRVIVPTTLWNQLCYLVCWSFHWETNESWNTWMRFNDRTTLPRQFSSEKWNALGLESPENPTSTPLNRIIFSETTPLFGGLVFGASCWVVSAHPHRQVKVLASITGSPSGTTQTPSDVRRQYRTFEGFCVENELHSSFLVDFFFSMMFRMARICQKKKERSSIFGCFWFTVLL